MTSTTFTFSARLEALKQSPIKQALRNIKHGVERECLRINANGSMSHLPHPRQLGSALTHETITTDFSESLLEFITPPESDVSRTLGQLHDIHKFVHENIGDERLWPMSMPCFVPNEDDIPLAQYGSSNIGKMKTLYREGLKNRYGSMMQVIAGVHFNFSLPEEFWENWLKTTESKAADKDTISEAYFALIRNYRRFCWLIPYLFGASPALCGSFVKGNDSKLPFQSLGQGTLYLPYATSLRMSDLGYTNSEQSDLEICYNQLDQYIASVRRAIKKPSEKFKVFEGKKDGKYQQLNANVLQIENELYSPIRPKQPSLPLEKPSDALATRGVNYVEVRALDVNPFSPVGIDAQQFYFLDVFLLYCLVQPSALLSPESYKQTEENLKEVVLRGRDPALTLCDGDRTVEMAKWAEELFSGFSQIATVLDEANQTNVYTQAVELQLQKIKDPDLTPSARLLNQLLEQQLDNGTLGINLAQTYKAFFAQQSYDFYQQQDFVEQARHSIHTQQQKEQADTLSFDEFLEDYFAEI